jgi:hypothetical protein
MLVSRYKIEIKEEPEFAGESFEERYARITASKQRLTTTYVMSVSSWRFYGLLSGPLRVPLVFKRR